MNYLIVDLANVFFRSRHVTNGDVGEKIGMALHITLNGVRKVWKDFKGDHVVFCLEGRSWRKDFYLPYKRNRSDARAALTVKEKEEETVFWETFDNFKEFLQNKTNCTVLQNSRLEADDLISAWIQAHPQDQHVIISTDSDFAQLIAPNVKQYNGVSEVTITNEGYFTPKGASVKDNKTGEDKTPPEPKWQLFEKCMRGDSTDNIFSAFPGVRTKGTKSKVGLREAYEDRDNKGFNWNNMMLQRWMDHEGVEHRVLDDYNRNVVLCDLTAQPDEIKHIMAATVSTAAQPKAVEQVGIKLIKFCAKWDMQRIVDQAQSYAEPLNAKYKITQEHMS